MAGKGDINRAIALMSSILHLWLSKYTARFLHTFKSDGVTLV